MKKNVLTFTSNCIACHCQELVPLKLQKFLLLLLWELEVGLSSAQKSSPVPTLFQCSVEKANGTETLKFGCRKALGNQVLSYYNWYSFFYSVMSWYEVSNSEFVTVFK